VWSVTVDVNGSCVLADAAGTLTDRHAKANTN
jgi:hypothetical protein